MLYVSVRYGRPCNVFYHEIFKIYSFFLIFRQGCTKGEHSNIKPAEPEKPKPAPVEEVRGVSYWLHVII